MLPPKACLPPGPKPWPIIGSLFIMMRNRPFFRWVHDTMSKMGYEIFCIRLGSVHVIVVTSPEIACEFLKKQDENFASRPSFLSSELVSDGFFTTALTTFGDQWKKMRRVLVTNILSPTTLHWMENKRIEEADHLVRYVYHVIKTNGGEVNVRVASQHFCGNVMRNMVFSKSSFRKFAKNGGPEPEEEEYVAGIFTILSCLNNFCISDYFPFLRCRMDLDGNEKRTRQAIENVRKYQDPLIDMRIEQWENGTRKEKHDLLDVLITLKNDDGKVLLTSKEIKAQILEIMLATIDNPSNAIEWALGEMINQPETLVKAVQELDQVVGTDRLVQETDLHNLNYIKACVKEAFRLHPVSPFNIPHVSISDTIVSSYFIPKGSHVLLSRPGLGRNSRIWDEPFRFKPERHLKNDCSGVILNDPDLHLLSFSIGRRGCPAVNLGSTISIMLLARLLQGFSWSPPPNTTSIELVEAIDEMVLSKPLYVFAKPRLNERFYVELNNTKV
ncbi:isoleucine N-monooxygenase 1-like [Impatiens glandulifera]|uniref:isoleucine N-monooxygenase 1-like n=1 Tax=Impatiens glandulifera TaxID=253017 RepID=UPI001FB06FAF|nr:isoleucine N-monooxygenase 1-like [Impatiens glandulifera]XP_047309400.1 isoleucine N-monooxygenase 1-like [Impatiens glandulifera]XP_047309407.1 isoleucine N-monooxygenase 1-like [Impatiens glandulifera]